MRKCHVPCRYLKIYYQRSPSRAHHFLSISSTSTIARFLIFLSTKGLRLYILCNSFAYFAAVSLWVRSMGQVLSAIQAKFRGQQWKQRQLKKISDRVFDHFKDDSHKDHLAFEDLYIAVLFVYNDINKHFPGPHIDPPSKARVKALMESYDVNLDGQLNREEFEGFIQELSKEALTIISRNVILALIVAPTVALLTKRATEGLPGVGKVVQRIPNSIYASIITLGVVMLSASSFSLKMLKHQ